MIRLVLFLMFLGGAAAAQEPVLEVAFEETEAIPGQSLSLRLTVLAPTYMPTPPVWPGFEAPNLLTRVGSSGPTSQRVDGETWSGITRRYLLAPMVPGTITLPAQQVVITWADPETNAALETTLDVAPITLTGIVPEGAEGLDPFVAANDLTLEQKIEGTPEGMAPGNSLTRTVTATIRGASPMFLTGLLPEDAVAGLRAYPEDPVFAESEDRGVVSGSRTETVTFVAEGGGSGSLSAVSLDWYNLETGAVETAEVSEVAVSVEGPPASTAAEPRDWRLIALLAAGAVLVLFLALLAVRRLMPPVRAWRARRRAAWEASEPHAWAELSRAVRGRDHAGLRPALDRWAARVAGPDPRRDARLADALAVLGTARYGAGGGDERGAWKALAAVLPQVRRTARRVEHLAALPPLNPGA
jgi:hypothetical protein